MDATTNRATHATGAAAKRFVDTVPGLGELPDLLLVERARARDTRAFEALMRRYNRRLYRIARSVLTEAAAAEEAVQSAYIRACATLDRYEPAGKFGAWLARLAFNEAVSSRHEASAAALGPEPSRPRAPAVLPATDGTFTRQQLEATIDALPEVFRTVWVLRVLEDLSGVEVAACLGLNETTVRTRLHRAQQRLTAEIAGRLRAQASNIFELAPERCDLIVAHVCGRLHSSVVKPER